MCDLQAADKQPFWQTMVSRSKKWSTGKFARWCVWLWLNKSHFEPREI